MGKRQKRIWSEYDIALNKQSTNLTAQLNGLSCPACESRFYTKNGKEKGNQRYRCSKCGKHFRNTTGYTIHHLHLKPKIQAYIDCMHQGLSLRKTAVKIGVSLQTAFRWRHRFLAAMHKHQAPFQSKKRILAPYKLPFSNKGKSGSKKNQRSTISILQIDSTTGQIAINLLRKYGHNAWEVASTINGHTSHLPSRQIPKILQSPEPLRNTAQPQFLQAQNIREQIDRWLAKFRGVATKYLENYWNWFMLVSQLQLKHSPQARYMHNCF